MDFQQLTQSITPEIYTSLKRAVEIGKWPDGRSLTEEQRELCMEAVIRYEHQHVDAQQRVGFIDRGSKAEGEMCDSTEDDSEPEATKPLKWT